MTAVVHKTATQNSHKTEREERQQNRRLSAHQSATSGTQDLHRFSILCDSQKHTYLSRHSSQSMLDTLSFLDGSKIIDMRGTRTYCSSACSLSYAQGNRHLLHTITAMAIWASPSRLTYAAENSRKHHQTLDIHALPSPNRVLENR